MSGYNITQTHFRDLFGAFLFSEPLQEEHRLYRAGETFYQDDIQFKISMVAIVDNTQHCNVERVVEDINVVYPHF